MQITHVSPFQTAKVFAVLYFLMSIPLVGLMALSFALSPVPRPGPGIGFMVVMPILYLVFGFIFTAIGAWVYNLAAGWVGGIEYTAVTVESRD